MNRVAVKCDANNNNTELNDRSRIQRPHEIDREIVINSIDLNPTLTSRDLVDGFDCDHITIWRILKATVKKRRKGHWVPYSSKQRNRVRIWRLHLNRRPRRQFLNNIVIVDENGCHLSIRTEQSLVFDQFKRLDLIFTHARWYWSVFGTVKDSFIRIWSSRDALWMSEYVVNNWSFIIVHLAVVVVQSFCCRMMLVLMLFDELKSNCAQCAMKWECLEHPPYSPDLPPSDYRSFKSLEHRLRN